MKADQNSSDSSTLSLEGKLSYVLLFAAWLVYAGPLLSFDTNLFLTDTFSQDIPLRLHAARDIRQGHMPDWTSLVHCGWPIFADSQTGIFYPPFLLYVLVPTPETHDLFMSLHFLMAGLFMQLFLINLNVHPLAALVGAITFMGGSYFQSTHIVPGVLAAGCWLPLTLYLIDRGANNKRSAWWWLSIVNSLIVLAGHLQVSLICFSMQLVYTLYRLGWKSPFRIITSFGFLYFIPLLLTSIQLVPTFWYNLGSTRMSGLSTGLTWETFSGSALRPGHLLTFFIPDLFGTPQSYRFPSDPFDLWEETLVVFQGYLAILLIPLGVALGRPRRDVWYALGLLLFVLLLATASPLYRLFHVLPIYSWFRWPTRYMLLFSLLASFLVAVGAEAIARIFCERRSRPLPFGLVLVVIAIFTLSGLHRTMGAFVTRSDFYSRVSPSILEASKNSSHFRLIPLARALYNCWLADEDQLRQNVNFLPVSYNMMFDVAAASLFDQGNAVTPRQVHEVLSLKHSTALRVAGVTHLSSPVRPEQLPEIEKNLYRVPIPPPAEQRVLSTQPCYLAQLKNPPPRAWLVHQTERIDDRLDRLNRLDSGRFDPYQSAIVEEDIPTLSQPKSPATVRWREPSPGRLEMEVATDADGLLVVADTFHPDFSVTLDGVPVRMLRTNHAFRGVVVPAGSHSIVMEYHIAAFSAGITMTVIGIVWVAIGLTRARAIDFAQSKL